MRLPADDTENLVTVMLGRYGHWIVVVTIVVVSICVTAYKIAELFS